MTLLYASESLEYSWIILNFQYLKHVSAILLSKESKAQPKTRKLFLDWWKRNTSILCVCVFFVFIFIRKRMSIYLFFFFFFVHINIKVYFFR